MCVLLEIIILKDLRVLFATIVRNLRIAFHFCTNFKIYPNGTAVCVDCGMAQLTNLKFGKLR